MHRPRTRHRIIACLYDSAYNFDMELNFAALRKEFPVLQRKTYLNSGSYCALANEVRAAFDAYMEDRLAVGANWDVWVMKNEAVRNLTAQLLRAAPDEIAVTASVSAGLNALASALQFDGPRNKVVTEVAPVGDFWEAEPEHQDYLERIPNGYTCHFVRPGWKLPHRAGAAA